MNTSEPLFTVRTHTHTDKKRKKKELDGRYLGNSTMNISERCDNI